jgi:hypothetical protein
MPSLSDTNWVIVVANSTSTATNPKTSATGFLRIPGQDTVRFALIGAGFAGRGLIAQRARGFASCRQSFAGCR